MKDRVWHPWLRIQRLIRAILEVGRDPIPRPVMKVTLKDALKEREKIEPTQSPRVAARLLRRVVDDGVILRDRRVQRSPCSFLHGTPRRRAPVQHLSDPGLHHVTAMKEGRPPPVPVLGQPQLESVALHPDDDVCR